MLQRELPQASVEEVVRRLEEQRDRRHAEILVAAQRGNSVRVAANVRREEVRLLAIGLEQRLRSSAREVEPARGVGDERLRGDVGVGAAVRHPDDDIARTAAEERRRLRAPRCLPRPRRVGEEGVVEGEVPRQRQPVGRHLEATPTVERVDRRRHRLHLPVRVRGAARAPTRTSARGRVLRKH